MIAALLSLLPGRAWLYGAAAAGLAMLIGWHVLHEAGQRRAAVNAAIAAADARWQGEIARANAVAEARLRANQSRIDELAARLIDEGAKLDANLSHIEAENAVLPTPPSCGLDRARVRLLERL